MHKQIKTLHIVDIDYIVDAGEIMRMYSCGWTAWKVTRNGSNCDRAIWLVVNLVSNETSTMLLLQGKIELVTMEECSWEVREYLMLRNWLL